jgi:hypothetical protein
LRQDLFMQPKLAFKSQSSTSPSQVLILKASTTMPGCIFFWYWCLNLGLCTTHVGIPWYKNSHPNNPNVITCSFFFFKT